ncbi:TPA: hypothetical protein ACWCGT_005015 [Escherichia coli]|nr:hypothetical protein [Escherichia coli]EFF9667451.1 hypothetical protein [Escherichia coli]ESN47707.1 hypothetical protein L363_05088 [Klebsiella pneumoniae MGH 17]
MNMWLTINKLPGALILKSLNFWQVSFGIKIKFIIAVSGHEVIFKILRYVMQSFITHLILFER